MATTYTLEQVRQHSKKDDLWIVVHNKVYDITKYLEEHPGGTAVLHDVAGTDATEAFEEIGHSEEARESLEAFYIGNLPETEQAEAVDVYRPQFEHVSQVAAIIPDRKRAAGFPRLVNAIVKIGLAGALGVAAYRGYRNGFAALKSVSAGRYLTWLQSSHGASGSSGSFWSGFGLASITQLSLTTGLVMWISTKLDVHEEFTHHKPYRPLRRDAIILRKPGKPVKAAKTPPLDPQKWRKFRLASKDHVSPNVYRFVFALPHADDVLGLPTGQHISLRATINGQSVSRSYTPVSNNTDLGRIELLIKVYNQGLMTKHLESMSIGDEIEIRGPKGAMKYSRSYAKHIGMIAGGTGITPMYQVIRAAMEDPEDRTSISLLYANNTEEDILLREELDALAKRHPEKFKVHYVLSSPSDTWRGSKGFVTVDLIKEHLHAAAEEAKVLLCGPPPMINAMKKGLVGLGFQEPGAFARATDQVFVF